MRTILHYLYYITQLLIFILVKEDLKEVRDICPVMTSCYENSLENVNFGFTFHWPASIPDMEIEFTVLDSHRSGFDSLPAGQESLFSHLVLVVS